MSRTLAGQCLMSALVVWIVGAGCAQPEQRPERRKSVRVRAPYTHVDVELPDDADEDVNVNVRVDR